MTPEEKAAEEARRRAAQEELARNAAGEGEGSQNIFEMIFGFLEALFKMLTGEEVGDGDRTVPDPEPDSSPDARTPGMVLFNGIRVSPAAFSAWGKYQNDHKGEAVTHINPLGSAATITDDRHQRDRHPRTGKPAFHHGIDMVPTGGGIPPVRASADGVVIFSGKINGYGNTVIIGHGNGDYTLYAHMTKKDMPRAGTEVDQGEVIGQMGNSGGSTGPHLHYEQRRGAASIVPLIAGRRITDGMRLELGTATVTPPAPVAAAPVAAPEKPAKPAGAPAAAPRRASGLQITPSEAAATRVPAASAQDENTFAGLNLGGIDMSGIRAGVDGALNTVRVAVGLNPPRRA